MNIKSKYFVGMVEAADQAVTIVDDEYKGQIKKTTGDLKDACQQLVNEAYPYNIIIKKSVIFSFIHIDTK